MKNTPRVHLTQFIQATLLNINILKMGGGVFNLFYILIITKFTRILVD